MTEEFFLDDQTGALTEAERERAQPFLNSLESVDLEEMTITTVRVGIRDVRTVKDEDGTARRVANPRIAEINNFVPMRVFNRMLSSRNKVMKQRQQYALIKDGLDVGEDVDPMVEWMLTQILEVWKLTPGEEDMTLARLEDGLDFAKIYKLFTIFFDKLMKQMGSGQTLVHNGSNSNHA